MRRETTGLRLALAQTILAARLKRKLSQSQVALRANVPRTYLSKLENGRVEPTCALLIRLGQALSTDGWNLLRCAEQRLKPRLAVEQREAA